MYEILYLISTKIEEKEIPNLVNQVEEMIKKLNGKILHFKNLGEKRLFYPIKKEMRVFGLAHYFEMMPEKIKEFEEKIKLVSGLLRFQIVKSGGWEVKFKKTEKREKKQKVKEEIKKEVPKKEKKIKEIDETDLFNDDIFKRIIES